MIRRGTHERKAERHIHRMVECKRLDRDECLIVIHAQGGVIARPRSLMKHRIGGEWPLRVDAFVDKRGDGRGDDAAVFLAERAGFTGMRVEAGDRQARAGETEALTQIAGNNSSGLDDELDRKLFEYFS